VRTKEVMALRADGSRSSPLLMTTWTVEIPFLPTASAEGMPKSRSSRCRMPLGDHALDGVVYGQWLKYSGVQRPKEAE
jgi:hypothetical protein